MTAMQRPGKKTRLKIGNWEKCHQEDERIVYHSYLKLLKIGDLENWRKILGNELMRTEQTK